MKNLILLFLLINVLNIGFNIKKEKSISNRKIYKIPTDIRMKMTQSRIRHFKEVE